MSQVVALAAEMDAAKVDWQLVMYGGALHSFTHAGPGYQEAAARRSWQAMETLFAEIF